MQKKWLWLIVVGLLYSLKGYGQEISIFSSAYLNTKSQFNYESFTNKGRRIFTGGLGGYVDTDKFTFYGEFMVSKASMSNKRIYDPFVDINFYYEYPEITRFTTRLGLGKYKDFNEKLRVRFITYLGFEFHGEKVDFLASSTMLSSNQIFNTAERTKPRDSTIEYGFKCTTEYKFLNKLYAGVGLDFRLYYYNRDGVSTQKIMTYDDFGELSNISIYTTDSAESKFGTSFFNLSLYLSYKLKGDSKN